MGRSLVNNTCGIAGTAGVGSVVNSACAGIPDGADVLVVGNGTWNDHITISGDQVFPLSSKLTPEAASQVEAVAAACAILQHNPVDSGSTIVVQGVDEGLQAALHGVAKTLSLKVANSGENVKLAITSANGDNVTNVAKQVGQGGTVVCVNNADCKVSNDAQVNSGVGSFIFQDKSIRGFDFYNFAKGNPIKCAEAVTEASKLLNSGKISVSGSKSFPQTKFQESISAAQSGSNVSIVIGK